MIIPKRAITSISRQSNVLPCLSASRYPGLKEQSKANVSQQNRSIVGLAHAIDKRVYRWAKSLMAPISNTEQIALGSGTIGFDRDIFSGSPSLQHLVDTYEPKLTEEEQSFLLYCL